MKTIEQKAKAYDEALVYAKLLLKTIGNATLGNLVLKNEFERMFPELKEDKESEDESIRKYIISSLNTLLYTKGSQADKERNDAIAWLEKQGEQKSLNDVAKEITKNKETAMSFLKSCGIMNANGELADEYKIEQDEQKPAEWSENDEEQLDRAIYMMEQLDMTKSWDDVYNWLKSLKDRVGCEANCTTIKEWSEEDEKEVAVLEAYIRSKDWSKRHIDRALGIVDELVNKVKSLRPQNRWKPSDEQIRELGIVATGKGWFSKEVLSELLKQLKKLREE